MNMDVRDVSRISDDKVEIDIIVSPRSGRSGIEGMDEWRKRLIVRVKAPPLDGKANKEVERLIEHITDSQSKIISGHMNRTKTVAVFGDPEKIIKALEAE